MAFEARGRGSRKAEKQAKIRVEGQNRETFKMLLQRHVHEGLIMAKMCWREYLPAINQLDAYKKLSLNTSGSRPKDLFNDVVEELEILLAKNCETVARVIQMTKSDLDLNYKRTFQDLKSSVFHKLEDIISKVTNIAEFRLLRDSLAAVSNAGLRLCFDEIAGKDKDRESFRLSKLKKHINNLINVVKVLFHENKTVADMQTHLYAFYNQAFIHLSKYKEYTTINNEFEKNEIYETVMQNQV